MTKLIFLVALLVAAFAPAFPATPPVYAAASSAVAVEEARAKQAVGRAIASPDGRYFIYEWLRPRAWTQESPAARGPDPARMQAWLYKVDATSPRNTSEYLFIPRPRTSYWLGELAPGARAVSLYGWDYDTNLARAGTWRLEDGEVSWFADPVDPGTLSRGPLWISDEDIVYLGRNGVLVRASAKTGKTRACPECSAAGLAPPGPSPVRVPPPAIQVGMPEGHERALAESPDGKLVVFVEDSPNFLRLSYVRNAGNRVVVFENPRGRAPSKGQAQTRTQ